MLARRRRDLRHIAGSEHDSTVRAGAAHAADGESDLRSEISRLLEDFSIEVTPREAARIADFRDHLPPGTRVYVPFLPGASYADTLATASKLARQDMIPVPHITACSLRDERDLETLLQRLKREAGVTEVLVIAGSELRPVGPFDRTTQLLETGLFEQYGIKRIGVAGHPEGNRDIGEAGIRQALEENASRPRPLGDERTNRLVTRTVVHP